MTTKTKRIAATILIGIPTLVLIIGGVMKLMDAEPEQVMQFLTKAGFGSCIKVLGLTELIIAALVLYPKTTKIGFLLMSSYFGGALCLELGGGMPPASAVFISLAWVGMFLKNRELFITE